MSNSNLPLGAEFDKSAPWNEKEEFFCRECDAEMDSDRWYCSTKCFNASNR